MKRRNIVMSSKFSHQENNEILLAEVIFVKIIRCRNLQRIFLHLTTFSEIKHQVPIFLAAELKKKMNIPIRSCEEYRIGKFFITPLNQHFFILKPP